MNFYIAATLACSLSYAIAAVICKHSMHPLQSGTRFTILQLTLFLIQNKVWIFGIIMTLATNATVLQLQSVLDLSVIHSILNTSFIFTLILGYLILGEQLTRTQWIGTITVMVGTVIMLFVDNPVSGQMTDMDNLMVLGVGSAVVIIILVILANVNHNLNFEILYAIAAGIAFGNGQVFVKTTTNFITKEIGGFSVLSMESITELFHIWPSLVVLAFSIFGFICMQISFAHGKVSITVALLTVISRAISTTSGYFIYGELFPQEKLVAIATILTGVFVITFTSVRATPNEPVPA